ncbi:MAG: metallophosphoesterase [Alloprevotella sp.]|nr:metallophosphoesterase [Alloprevotella sp.]
MLPTPTWIKLAVTLILCAAFSCLFIFYGIGPDSLSYKASVITYQIGNTWLIVMLYATMLFLIADILHLFRILPATLLHDSWAGTIISTGILTLTLTLGYLKYQHKERVVIDLHTEKQLSRPYRIVLLSDLHLGYHNRREEFSRWVTLINNEKPDAVLIAGDIIDVSVKPLLHDSIAQEFRKLRVPVYACLGNHEYYSGDSLATQFFNQAGIHLLRDQSIDIAHDLSIIGRDDRTNPHRKSIATLAKQADPHNFIIVLDHQPYHLERAQHAGIDFQFSGHTHHGQVWPMSLITELIYEDAFGPLQKGNTFYYVSSGMGIWGGKIRVGTQSEYIVANIHN